MFRINGYAGPVIAHDGMSKANQRGRVATIARRKREKEAARQTWIDRLMADTLADIREIERGGHGPSN